MTTRTGKKTAAILLALSAGFILASCDSIEALPANYESPIMETVDEGEVDVYENLMGVLYDGTSSNKKDDVLSNFMDIIAKDQFGSYSELLALAKEGDTAKLAEFASKHKGVYYHENKVNDGDKEVTEDAYLASKFGLSEDEVRAKRVLAFYESVTDKINEVFYNEITSKSYNDDTGKFYEKRLAYAHYANLYDIDLGDDTTDWYEGYLTPELKKEDVSSVMHLEDGRYDDYIERNIIRTVYKDKLVEEYLIENNYSTLGRAYARKVNIVKLSRDEKFKDLPAALLKAYSDAYITAAGQEIDFEVIANAWRGFYGLDKDGNASLFTTADKEYSLLVTAGLTPIDNGDGTHFRFAETQYGQLIDKYNKIDESNRYASEEATSALVEFTGNYTYTKEKGLKIKLAELALTDYTTDGWYVKNGGLSDLPDAIRNRLFNIKVSNEVDEIDAEHTYEQSDYVRFYNDHYYLTPATSEVGDNYNHIIYNDGSYYIVEVVEAPSTSKLNIDGSEGYVAKKPEKGVLFTEEVAHKVASTLGTKDSYINNAYSSYIEKYSVVYHDSAIYDYFKEKYPELFD